MDINAPINPNLVLARHFSQFCFDVYSSEICFFHNQIESACGGDDVSESPFAFAIRRQANTGSDSPAVALFICSGLLTSFLGVFSDSTHAYDYLCDYYSEEVFQSEFVMLSTESVDN